MNQILVSIERLGTILDSLIAAFVGTWAGPFVAMFDVDVDSQGWLIAVRLCAIGKSARICLLGLFQPLAQLLLGLEGFF
jgi:hypothetical protein